MGTFFQDDLRVNAKLTLNLGCVMKFEIAGRRVTTRVYAGFDTSYVQPIEAAAKAKLLANPVTGVDPNAFSVKGGLLLPGGHREGLYRTPKDFSCRVLASPISGIARQYSHRLWVVCWISRRAARRCDSAGLHADTTAALTTNINGAPLPYTLSTPFANTTILEPVGNSLGKQTALGQAISFFNQNPKSR